VSDIDTVVVDSLKVLDPKRPIREADMAGLATGLHRSRMTQGRPTQCPVAATHPLYQLLNSQANAGPLPAQSWL